MILNKIRDFERPVCEILAQVCYHLDPQIINYIQEQNRKELSHFSGLFLNKIEIKNYLFEGSACVFPGVRRYVSGEGKKKSYNDSYKAIIDDNTFPRHIWCFLANGVSYSGPSWKKSGLNEFELAHIFTHKESELAFEKEFFQTTNLGLFPHGDFTCACNVILLPKGMVRPTDTSKIIKSVFYMRYIELYGELTLNGRQGFNKKLIPDWYADLKWNAPFLPEGWQKRIDKLLAYRTNRISQILNKVV